MFPTVHGIVGAGGKTAPAPGPGGPYLHYRLLIEAYGGSSGAIILNELELRATPGGPTIATGGTPFASSTSGGRPAGNAFDGVQNSFWQSRLTPQFPEHIGYTLPEPAEISQYALRKYFTANASTPSAWKLQGSNDGATWDTLATETGIVWSGPNYEWKVFSV